jgi:uncharacterized protein (UPF0332 family)
LRAARRLADGGDHDFAISRAYYAMFYLAQAMLLTLDLEFRRHRAVISALAQQFVRPARFETVHLDAFREAFERRQVADYDDEGVVSAREGEAILQQAVAFVEAAEAYLRSLP